MDRMGKGVMGGRNQVDGEDRVIFIFLAGVSMGEKRYISTLGLVF